jgi:hypothetical protein
MTVLAVFLLMLVFGLVGYLLRQSGEGDAAVPPDPEALRKAAVELHRIHRRLEAADLKQRQRRDAARFKRDLAEALDKEAP